MKTGDSVKYTDETGKKHNALLTAVHGPGDTPAVNLVYVTDDDSQHDPYGNQLVRQTSQVHKNNQSAHGRFWE